jgi:hypothetical protein
MLSLGPGWETIAICSIVRLPSHYSRDTVERDTLSHPHKPLYTRHEELKLLCKEKKKKSERKRELSWP